MQDLIADVFAEVLVRFVRDIAIRNCLARLTPEPRNPIGKRYAAALGDANLEPIRDLIVPDCVDQAIFCLLNEIDGGGLKLTFTGPDGRQVDLTEDGLSELAGWYVMEEEEGWRERFSRKRINHY